MRKFKFDSLSNIKLEMEPLTESPEGLLLGGFVGLAGTYDAPVPNNGCNNNGCTTDRINNGCTNSGCINNGCTNNVTMTKITSQIICLFSTLLYR